MVLFQAIQFSMRTQFQSVLFQIIPFRLKTVLFQKI